VRTAGRLDGPASWRRLAVLVLLGTIGGVSLWSVVVILPSVQAEFAVARGGASLPYTLTLIGFGIGGVLMGRAADRFGVFTPVIFGAVVLCVGYIAAGFAATLWQFLLAHAVLIGLLGSSATFAPLVADVSHWFVRRRALAVAICACGNYFAGVVWPPVVEHFVQVVGWRRTEIGIGVACLVTMVPLAFALRSRPPEDSGVPGARPAAAPARLSLSPNAVQALLVIAGVACCVAMAMPQVHIVAYCGDLGYGVAHGAAMLSLMLGCGVVSRVASGWIADMIGGLPTLLLSSALQCLTLVLYLGFDSLTSLYAISAAFGLVQGGIIPSYAFVVREYFPPGEAGARIGLVLMASLFGMALGGWMSGVIFDLTGSYEAAFANGVLWNLLNAAIATWLLLARTPSAAAPRRGSQGGAAASRA